MRAYIEPADPLAHLLKKEPTFIEIIDTQKNYTRGFACRPLPWTIEHDDEELGTINFIPYDINNTTQ